MEQKYYANEPNVLILVALLKAHGIKRVIASPGTTNLSFVASLQHDSYFEMFSCVDERSAAYMAVGMAAETNEPVVITCTGATASRNYLPALTEAYYRKLPILVVTGTQHVERIGQLHSQVIDRSQAQKDAIKSSYLIDSIKDKSDIYYAQLKINKAIDDLTKREGGPVHINLRTDYVRDYSVKELPEVNVIKRIGYDTIYAAPEMPDGRIGILLTSHNTLTSRESDAIDRFCASRNAVVFCDHTSGYYGKYKVNFSLPTVQLNSIYEACKLDLCIHVGEVSAEYGMLGSHLSKKNVWRVSHDGEMRDLFGKMSFMFDMTITDFFSFYTIDGVLNQTSYLEECQKIYNELISKTPDLPFSNVWIASQITPKIPEGSCIHLGILNSIRTWNLFSLPKNVTSFSNVGGFGIDGCVSSLLGASFINPEKLYFGVVGDLAFFYDMNCLGNRHIGNNVRLLIVNNGHGQEFRNFYHVGSTFGEEADKYIAAGGHYGSKSKDLVKHFAQDLGFDYISAYDKDSFLNVAEKFISPNKNQRSIVFEVFTETQNESDAIKAMWEIDYNAAGLAVQKSQKFHSKIRKIIGREGIEFAKALLRKK